MDLLAFILINAIALLLLFVKSKRHINLWYSGYLFFFSLGLLVSFIDPHPKTYIVQYIVADELAGRFLSCLSFRFSPWFFLSAYISMSNEIKHKKILYYALLAPIVLSFGYDIVFPKDSFVYIYLDYSRQFTMTALWVIPYVLMTNALSIHTAFKESNLKHRIQKIALAVLTLPSLYVSYQIYVLPNLTKNASRDFTMVTTVFGFFITILFVIFASRVGIFGIKINYQIDKGILDDLAEYDFNETEKAVLIDTVRKFSIADTAERNNLAPQTVKNIRNTIYKKVGVQNAKELIEKFT